jgi:hypothetical protein
MRAQVRCGGVGIRSGVTISLLVHGTGQQAGKVVQLMLGPSWPSIQSVISFSFLRAVQVPISQRTIQFGSSPMTV